MNIYLFWRILLTNRYGFISLIKCHNDVMISSFFISFWIQVDKFLSLSERAFVHIVPVVITPMVIEIKSKMFLEEPIMLKTNNHFEANRNFLCFLQDLNHYCWIFLTLSVVENLQFRSLNQMTLTWKNLTFPIIHHKVSENPKHCFCFFTVIRVGLEGAGTKGPPHGSESIWEGTLVGLIVI